MRAIAASVPLEGEALVSYDALTARLKKLSALGDIEGIITWDELVMMPEGASEARGAQKAALAELVHNEATSDKMGEAISAAESAGAAEVLPPAQGGCSPRQSNQLLSENLQPCHDVATE